MPPLTGRDSMHTLIVSDIFGRTTALEKLAGQLASRHGVPRIIDPYKGSLRNFSSEPEAYAAFQREVGLDRYIETLGSATEACTQPLRLIGFSVGATAVWALSGMADLPRGSRAICFYGAQIRHLLSVRPQMPVQMILPASEPHFDVTALADRLSATAGVACRRTAYLHGFMNRLSVNFDAAAYGVYRRRLQTEVRCEEILRDADRHERLPTNGAAENRPAVAPPVATPAAVGSANARWTPIHQAERRSR
ncbi:MAG: dienelactone hydrolase family protein [Desulfosarcinaceae bacterium]|nr:dienelactone hydrolase family protein [Desulfosarcinaceae bacterium]